MTYGFIKALIKIDTYQPPGRLQGTLLKNNASHLFSVRMAFALTPNRNSHVVFHVTITCVKSVQFFAP